MCNLVTPVLYVRRCLSLDLVLDLSLSLLLRASASSLSFLGSVLVNCSSAMLCSVRHAVRLLIRSLIFHPALRLGAHSELALSLILDRTYFILAWQVACLLHVTLARTKTITCCNYANSINLERGDQSGFTTSIRNISFANTICALIAVCDT